MDTSVVPVKRVRTKQLAVQTHGEGIPFVWSHTLLGSMAQDEAGGVFAWSELADIARVIRFDAVGHGLSDASDNPDDHTWEQRAADMWKVADEIAGAEPVVLGGASMGAATALHAACDHPGRVKALVLAIPPSAWEARARQVRLYRGLSRCIDWMGAGPFKFLQGVARMRVPPKSDFRQTLERNTAVHFRTDDPGSMNAALQGAASSDLPPAAELEALSMPTLILAWPGDTTHPLSTAKQLASLLPDATLLIADDNAAPFDWTAQVREFLEALH